MRRNRRITLLVSASLLALVAAAGCGSTKTTGSKSTAGTAAAASGATPIKVGLICDCSGAYGVEGTGGTDVYRAWVNTVNAAGGLDGHQVQLIVEDDQSVPGKSIAAAQTLISDRIDALVDMTVEDSTWASTIQAANIPVVGGDTPNTPFGTNPDWYPQGQTSASSMYSVISMAKAAGATNIGVLYCAEAALCEQFVPLAKTDGAKLGVPAVYSESIGATDPDYTAQCVAAQDAHVTALAVFDESPQIARLAQDCSRQGYHPIYVAEGAGFAETLVNSPGLTNLWEEYSVLPFWDTSSVVKAMDTAVDKYYPGLRSNTTNWTQAAALGWPAGLLLKDAVKAGGLTPSAAPSAAEIVHGLASLKGDTLDGWSPPLTFAAGQPHQVNCWFTTHLDNGSLSLANDAKSSCES